MRPGPRDTQVLGNLEVLAIRTRGNCRRIGHGIAIEGSRYFLDGVGPFRGMRERVRFAAMRRGIVENAHRLFPRATLPGESLGQLDANPAATSGNIISWCPVMAYPRDSVARDPDGEAVGRLTTFCSGR